MYTKMVEPTFHFGLMLILLTAKESLNVGRVDHLSRIKEQKYNSQDNIFSVKIILNINLTIEQTRPKRPQVHLI